MWLDQLIVWGPVVILGTMTLFLLTVTLVCYYDLGEYKSVLWRRTMRTMLAVGTVLWVAMVIIGITEWVRGGAF